MGASNKKISAITEHIRGIVFLGTPFRNSRDSTWEEIVQVMVAVFAKKNVNSIELPESDGLRDIVDEFSVLLGRGSIKVAFFFETSSYRDLKVSHTLSHRRF